ncbi:MAG TPA: glycerol kinase GlpK [Terriglobia bacterium]|nr:glycerol kinase GlpK [Terriglobia bacterium]
MKSKRYILALDQGTTSSRALLFDRAGAAVAVSSREFKQYYPQPAWVEHDALEIWDSQRRVAEQVVREAGAAPEEIAAIGITNQRETVVLWDRKTSEPLSHAIVWQCRRTAGECARIEKEDFGQTLREKTGLVVDAYFSATKIAWLLNNVPDARRRAEHNELACGTIDSWLIWKLTDGKVHATDVSNASRTLLFNIHTLKWDDEILRYFRIPESLLPHVLPSSGILGETKLLGHPVPIAGVAGDQQASLFGHGCVAPGSVKNTYGTGCFLLMNTGSRVARSESGLISTVAWQRGGTTNYALEGSIFIAGASIQWLRDELKIIKDAADTQAMAQAVPDTGGVYFVPAFVGLGAPYWDAYARGTLVGLTRGTGRNAIARAALESMAYQTRDVVECMARDSRMQPSVLRVDGGATRNDFLCQFQADILGIPVERARVTETTALGAACLAGLATGFWRDEQDMLQAMESDSATKEQEGKTMRFEPQMEPAQQEKLYAGWRRAVERAKAWAEP